MSESLTDDAVLTELGHRLSRHRLELQLTQADVAEQAGIAKRTLERIEAGASAQTATVVRLFRVLDLLPALDQMLPEAQSRPLDLLKRKGRQRQRASKQRKVLPSAQPWTWDDGH